MLKGAFSPLEWDMQISSFFFPAKVPVQSLVCEVAASAGTVLLNTFSLLAGIERDLISERTKRALAAKKAQEVKLGRPKGKSKLDSHEDKIHQLIKNWG